MARITTAYVSRYQFGRVNEADILRSTKVTLVANFKGATDALITTATWYTTAPWSTVLSAPTLSADQKSTTVWVQGGLPDLSILKCQVNLSDGAIMNQAWRVRVTADPWYDGEIVPAEGPSAVTVNA